MTARVRISEREGSSSPVFFLREDENGNLMSSNSIIYDSGNYFGLSTLSDIFLPSGFPGSVSPDYVGYQIFDSLQAFSSTIAGLLSSRAVLEGFGVGDEKASSTNAVLLSVLQDATGRLATILFAWRFGPALAPEAKMYRLAADIFNDSAIVLDCLSPALPTQLRITALCSAGALRALCGVCGGGSKAALSIHFARAGNVGELNAKDASQETVIGLLGMLCGSFVMSHITSRTATWISLSFLLLIHLGTNYLAVRSVALTTFSRQRANIAYGTFFSHVNNKVLKPSEVAQRERIFEVPGILRDPLTDSFIGTCSICSSAEDLLPLSHRVSPSAWKAAANIFRDEVYFLLIHSEPGVPWAIRICFKHEAKPENSVKAWLTAFEFCRMSKASSRPVEQDTTLSGTETVEFDRLLRSSLEHINKIFPKFWTQAGLAGWDLTTDAICTKSIRTIFIKVDGVETKKTS